MRRVRGCSQRFALVPLNLVYNEENGDVVVPRVIEFLTALPKTQTGKVQRKQLRQQEIPGAG